MTETCTNCGRELPATDDPEANRTTTVTDLRLQAEGYCPHCDTYGATDA